MKHQTPSRAARKNWKARTFRVNGWMRGLEAFQHKHARLTAIFK